MHKSKVLVDIYIIIKQKKTMRLIEEKGKKEKKLRGTNKSKR